MVVVLVVSGNLKLTSVYYGGYPEASGCGMAHSTKPVQNLHLKKGYPL